IKYRKHHKGYVEKLNELVTNTPYEKMTLEDAVIHSREKKEQQIFNQAAQTWNHSFYWNGLAPHKKWVRSNGIAAKIKQTFHSQDAFQKNFSELAVHLFGSGWVWLVKNEAQEIAIKTTKDADNFLGT